MRRINVRMGAYIVLSLAAGLGAAAPMAASAQNLQGRELNVVSWGGVWTEASRVNFFEPFEKETGVKINIIPATGDFDAMVRLQSDQGALRIDLLDGGQASLLRKDGYVEPFPPELVASLKEQSREGVVREDGVQYGSTATVIVCNPDMVAKCPTNAAEFWDVEGFPGPRAITGNWTAPLFSRRSPLAAIATT